MKTIYPFICLIPFLPNPASACDSCAIYVATEALGDSATGWFVGSSTQYTYFGTTQLDGHEVNNEADQHLASTFVQAVVGYSFTPRFSAQLNLPYIYRSYERPEGFATDRGAEEGIGDVSLTGHFQVMRSDSSEVTFIWNVLGGVKFPTGSSYRIKEEFNEVEVPGAPESGIHGHDLALGSGSFDGVVGTSGYYRYQRAFATASVQYSLRLEGDYDYRYANALSWETGVGAYLLLEHTHTLSLEAVLSGEYKRTDTFQGEDAEDTAINAVFLGPKLIATVGTGFSADLGVDIPLRIQNSAFQTVPDVRVRAGLLWRF